MDFPIRGKQTPAVPTLETSRRTGDRHTSLHTGADTHPGADARRPGKPALCIPRGCYREMFMELSLKRSQGEKNETVCCVTDRRKSSQNVVIQKQNIRHPVYKWGTLPRLKIERRSSSRLALLWLYNMEVVLTQSIFFSVIRFVEITLKK